MKIETLRVGLHPGLDPGTCVCAGGHLHIKATVQNLAGVALGKVRVTGKAFGAGDELLGTATADRRSSPKPPPARLSSHEVVRFSARFASCPVYLAR